MGTGGRKGGARREPNFDSAPDSAPAVQVEPRPRPAGGSSRRKTKRKAARKKARGAWFSLKRLRPGRFVYWMLVLALWGVIAGIGGVFWLGAHLPPKDQREGRLETVCCATLDCQPAGSASRYQTGLGD